MYGSSISVSWIAIFRADFFLEINQWQLLHDGESSLAPVPRSSHTAITLPDEPNCMIIFGGYSDYGPLNDVRKFNLGK
jgi:hypothetical protein